MDAGTPRSREETQPLIPREDNMTSGQLVPRLFTCLPALDNAASYLAETTTCFTSCFPQFSAADSSTNEQELLTFSSEGERVSLTGSQPFTSWINGNWNAHAPSRDAAAVMEQMKASGAQLRIHHKIVVL